MIKLLTLLPLPFVPFDLFLQYYPITIMFLFLDMIKKKKLNYKFNTKK